MAVLTTKKDDEDQHPSEPLKILLKDEDFIKPNIKMNSKFELVKMENGMTGLLISDPFGIKSHLRMSIFYGGYIDTVQSIFHFDEHMVLQGSEKYGPIFPFFNKFMGIKNLELNAATTGNLQTYYITLPYNFEYEKAIDMLTDVFKYPLYSIEIIKNEIEAVNHEFYEHMDTSDKLLDNIIRQLS